MIAITFALPAESSAFCRRLRGKKRFRRDGLRIVSGRAGRHTIEVLYTGVGEKVCRERIAVFLQHRQFSCLISSGFAGALTNQLQPGDLLLASNYSTTKADVSKLSKVKTGNLHTSPKMVDSPKERSKLAAKTKALAVDMETEFIARACAEHALPIISLRAITDTPDKPFPAPPHVLFDLSRQRTRASRLAFFLITHPHRIPRLILFARRIKRAKKNLARGLIEVLRGISDPRGTGGIGTRRARSAREN